MDLERIEQVGYEKGADRAASFLQNGDQVLKSQVRKEQPLVLMDTGTAAQKYPELVKQYWWRAVQPDTDEFTQATANAKEEHGYFVHVKRGRKSVFRCRPASS